MALDLESPRTRSRLDLLNVLQDWEKEVDQVG